MANMMDFIDEMRARLSAIADSERTLLRALADTLSRADQTLMEQVRGIATDHSNRRGVLLHELESLAARIGAFPTARDTRDSLEAWDAPEVASLPHASPDQDPSVYARGDWRAAANNIEDELECCLKTRAHPN